MLDSPADPLHQPQRLTLTHWLICIIASIGFLFDTYELLMLPLIIKPAMRELVGATPGTPVFDYWYKLLFYLPAVAGGIFGLLGGYLTDRLGRRRVLTWSILLYAGSACAAGLSTSMPMLVTFRVTTFIGVCVEFVAAVAWLAELFPAPAQRERILGITQAFSSLGGLLVAIVFRVCSSDFANNLPAIQGAHEAWRYTLISGLIPALPLILVRPFLPESPIWQTKRLAGTLRRPRFGELFQPSHRRVTIVASIMFACSLGVAFGAIQHIARVVPSLTDVKSLPRPAQEKLVGPVQTYQETGGLLGRCVLAYLAVHIASRRTLIRLFQIPGLIITPLVFFTAPSAPLWVFQWGILLVGFMAVAQLSFWGNYLPRVYPTHLRGTGESFAANIGGRMIGTAAALVTTELAARLPGPGDPVKFAYAAGTVGLAVYVIGFIASFWLPEPASEALPE